LLAIVPRRRVTLTMLFEKGSSPDQGETSESTAQAGQSLPNGGGEEPALHPSEISVATATFHRDPKRHPSWGFYPLANGDAEVGDVYRVQREENDIMHMQTFLIIRTGSVLRGCKIEEHLLKDSEPKYTHTHARLLVRMEEDDTPRSSGKLNVTATPRRASAELPPLEIIMDDNQNIKDNCWVDLREDYNITLSAHYRVAYCGKLTVESCKIAREKWHELNK
jgi:hypothetical protein